MLAELGAKSPDDLEAERRKIVGEAGGDYKSLSEETLQRLAFITSTLRRRSSGPPKAPKAAGTAPKKKPSLDSVMDLL